MVVIRAGDRAFVVKEGLHHCTAALSPFAVCD